MLPLRNALRSVFPLRSMLPMRNALRSVFPLCSMLPLRNALSSVLPLRNALRTVLPLRNALLGCAWFTSSDVSSAMHLSCISLQLIDIYIES